MSTVGHIGIIIRSIITADGPT